MADRPTEARHPYSAGLHAAPASTVLTQLLSAQQAALSSVSLALPAIERVADAAAQAIARGDKLAYAGAGSSGLMALADCLELAGTFGIPPLQTPMLFAGGTDALLHMTGAVEDDPALAHADLARAGLRKGDVVLCLSASGTTPYTLVIAEQARALGVVVAGFANVADSPLLAMSDIAVCLPTGPEVVSGSTRMGAATAQKVALNMMSVLMGIRLGHLHDGYMVNVVADNSKLVARAARIVSAIAGQDAATAQAALAQTGGAVKAAILVAMGMDPDMAHHALARNGGNLARLIGQGNQ